VLLPPEQAVADWPPVDLDAEAARRVRNGMPIGLGSIAGERARAHGPDGALLALLSRAGELWQPDKVFDWT
jgi:tRNA pseudouridine55 synthase